MVGQIGGKKGKRKTCCGLCSGPFTTAKGYQLARRHTEKNVLCVFQEYISHQQGTPTEGSKRLTKANNSL